MQESQSHRGVRNPMEIINPTWGYITVLVIVLLYIYAEGDGE